MADRVFKGVWLPREIWLDERLDAVEKVILAEIDSLDDINECYASNQYFAEFCRVSESKITRSISKLKELGYITTEMTNTEHGTKRVIKMTEWGKFFTKGCSQNDEGGVVKMTRGVSANCRANNIYNNNTKDNINPLNIPLTDYFESERLNRKLFEWVEYRKGIKKPYKTEDSIRRLADQIKKSGLSEEEIIESFNHSMSMEYQGVFFNKKTKKKGYDWDNL